MATDYDQPRRSEADDLGEDSLEELKARRAEAQASSVDVDEADLAEALELLPGPPPQPAGVRQGRPVDLLRVRVGTPP